MKFAILRAPRKQTVVKWEGQIAKNDEYFTDSSESSDFYTVLCSELLNHFDQVEIWYQRESFKKERAFCHDNGLIERYWEQAFRDVKKEDWPDILFVRGDMMDYRRLLDRLHKEVFLIYYSAGKYYEPQSKYWWDLVFVDDPRHMEELKESLEEVEIRLFKKSCVDKYFPGGKGGNIDVYFTCNGPQWDQKGLRFFLKIMTELRKKAKAVCVGLKDPSWDREFKGLPVYFTGYVPRVHVGQVMARSGIGLVLSTERDGSPRVIQEYLCSDLPMVVRGTTTCSDLYLNSETGIRAENDVEVLPAVIDLLSRRGDYRPRDYFMKNLTVQESARYLIECIEETKDSLSHV